MKKLFESTLNQMDKILKGEYSGSKEPVNIKDQVYCDSLVFNLDYKLLILKRTETDDFEPGKWGLPGGKLESNESVLEGALRELMEESNIVLNPYIVESQSKLDHYKNRDNSVSHYFGFKLNTNDINIVLDTEEHCDYKWIDLDDIKKYDFIFDLGKRIIKLSGQMKVDPDRPTLENYSKVEGFEIVDVNTYLDELFDSDEIGVELYSFYKSEVEKKGKSIVLVRTKNGEFFKDETEANKELSSYIEKFNKSQSKNLFSEKNLLNFVKKASTSNLEEIGSENPTLKRIAVEELEVRNN